MTNREPWRVSTKNGLDSPGVPILFFGDLDAYMTSRPRVLTVGKNPSSKEFPAGERFQRFPRLTGDRSDRKPGTYLKAMSDYFCCDKWYKWFSDFEPVLNGAGASYFEGRASTALHTDICSPVATDPTWSRLTTNDREALEKDGSPLWNQLVTILKPQIVLLSFAREYLSLIDSTSLDDWRPIREFEAPEKDGKRRESYRICARWWDVHGEPSLFVFGQMHHGVPFQRLSKNRRREVGRAALDQYKRGQ